MFFQSIAFLLAITAGAPPSGPAVLFIHTTAHGEQFAYFSSFERCEAFRHQLEAEWERRTRNQLGIAAPRPLPRAIAGTESSLRCIPG